MKEKYGDKGFNIFAISKEDPGAIESKGISAFKINYFVGAVDDATVKSYGIRGWPTHFVVGPDGNIVKGAFHGMIDTKEVDGYIEQLVPRSIDRELAKGAQKAGKYFDKGEFGKAHAEAVEVIGGEASSEEDKKDAGYVKELVEKHLELDKKSIERLESGKDYLKLFELLENGYKSKYKGMEIADQWKEKHKELQKDKEVKKEIKAAEEFVKVKEKWQKAVESKSESKMESVRGELRKFVKKHIGTKAAEDAEKLIK